MTAATDSSTPAAAVANAPSAVKLALLPKADPPATDLPAVPEDVTASWLSSVLDRKVKSAKVEKTLPGTASKVFVTVVFEDDADSRSVQLCVKGGFDPNFIKAMPWIVMIYQREVDFYNQVAPSLTHMDLPKSWWGSHNATQGIVIMDDLAALGSSFGTPAETWPVSRVLAGVEQLAALHSKTWHVLATDYPWLTSDYDQAILTLMQTFDAVVKGTDRPKIHEYLKDQPRILAVLKKHYASRNPKFQCLLHGDAHTGNTFIDDGAPRFLDWQMIHIGSAFHDVAYFIGGALSVEDRRAREWDIVDHYLRSLEKFGVAPLFRNDEDVVAEYKKSFLAGIGWIMCPYEMQPKECVHPMALRYSAALDDHKVLELVEGLPEPHQLG